MQFDISFERTFPHPIGKVWQALTDASALGAWLMKTDFVAETGRTFRMWCDDNQGGTDLYICKVLALEPQRRMVWSWVLDGQQAAGRSIVEFGLEEVPEGTRLTIQHRGDLDPDRIEQFEGGWPTKIDMLEEAI